MVPYYKIKSVTPSNITNDSVRDDVPRPMACNYFSHLTVKGGSYMYLFIISLSKQSWKLFPPKLHCMTNRRNFVQIPQGKMKFL